MGFRRVVVDFLQPPLSKGKEAFRDLWLAVYQPTPALRKHAIDADVVRAFIDDYWFDCCGTDYAQDAVYREMLPQFIGTSAPQHFPVVDLSLEE